MKKPKPKKLQYNQKIFENPSKNYYNRKTINMSHEMALISLNQFLRV